MHNGHLGNKWKLREELMMSTFLKTPPNSVTRQYIFTNNTYEHSVFIFVHTNTDFATVRVAWFVTVN
jgi:hypothetical protein